MLTYDMNIRRLIFQFSLTELALTCVDSMQRGKAITSLLSLEGMVDLTAINCMQNYTICLVSRSYACH